MEQNLTGIQWVASEAWVTASVFTESKYYPLLGGTIGFGIRQGHIPGLQEYLMMVNPQKYPSNPLQHSAYMNTSNTRITYNVYKGVYAIAHSLHNLMSCRSFLTSDCCVFGKQVPVSVCSDSCTPGFRKAVRNGEPLCCFDCVPYCMACPDDYWSNVDGTACIPKVVEFLSHDAMGVILTVIAVVGACVTLSVFTVFLYHRNTPIVRINNSELSFFVLFSLTLCFLCALIFIGEPTSCQTVDCIYKVRYITPTPTVHF
uniref:G-protein coupled receptors family 3 profile domain-containing protein n=1 Tax=Electrophorus electricus TaxID=8005 RepID=A0AAY5F4H6_ELEEL